MKFGIQDLIQLLGSLSKSEHSSYFFQLFLVFRKQKKFPCLFLETVWSLECSYVLSPNIRRVPACFQIPQKAVTFICSVWVCGDENISDIVKLPVAEDLLYLQDAEPVMKLL